MTTNMKLVFTVYVLLFLLSNFGFSTTRIFPNGTTIIDSRGDLRFNTRSTEANIELEGFQFNSNIVTALHNKDFHASGRNIVLQGSELQFMCPLETANITTNSKNLRLIHGVGGFVEIDNLKFGDNALISKNGNIIVEPSDSIEMRTGQIIGDPLSSDYFNLTSKSSHLKLGTDDSGDILLDAGENHSVKIVASRLDLIGAALNLTGTHVTLDQIISQSLLINGTLITTTESDVDIILSPQGNGVVRVGSGKTFDVSSATLLLRDDQISGSKIEGGVINAIQINTLTSTTVISDTLSTNTLTSSGSTVTLASGKTLDVSSGVLKLADGQISGDKIEGGTIDSVSITNLTSGLVTVDNIKIDGNTIEANSGDLNLQCGVGSVVKILGTLATDSINSTSINANILLSPQGMGAVKVAEGKTFDLRGVTLLIDDDAIKRMDNVTINELVGHLITSGKLTIGAETISSTGDIRLSPAGGRKVEVTQPLIVEKLKLDYNTISTTTGQPVTINNLTCPVAAFNKVTVGTLQIEDNEVSCIGATCDVVLKSDVVLGAGKSITGTTSDATFQTVKTSTVSTTSGDLTLNPTGQNVKISPSKTLDVTGATLKIDDDSISGDKIEGGSVNQMEVKDLRSDEVSVSGSVQVNGSVDVGSGGVESKGGVRDSHAWGSEAARKAKLSLGANSVVLNSGPMNASFFEGFDASGISPGNMKGFIGNVFDGRYVYIVPHFNGNNYHGKVARYDTQQPFTSSNSWTGYDASATSPGNMVGLQGGVFDGRYVYFAPESDGSSHGRFLRYDTKGDFKSSTSWCGFDANGVSPGGMVAFGGAVFDGRYAYMVPYLTGRVLRYDTQLPFTLGNSWTGFDASGTSPGGMTAYSCGVFDGHYIYFVPRGFPAHGKVLRYDTQQSFTSSSGWTGYDASGTAPGTMKGYRSAVFDGRFIYFAPGRDGNAPSGKVLRYDTKQNFTSSCSWTGYDASETSPGGMQSFTGSIFDGRFVYMIPETGRLLRYDTHAKFTSQSSWSGFDASGTSPGLMQGFWGGVFDGRFIYMAPYSDGTNMHGRVLRYDTRSPQPRPSIQQIASNEDLFIASDSKVGIGTTSPTEQLHVEGSLRVTEKVGISTPNSPSTELEVKGTARIDKVEVMEGLSVGANTTELGNGEAVRVEGGVMASGGVRDSHAWGGESSRRAKLALGLNCGGYGSSVFTGGPMNSTFFDGFDASGVGPGNIKGFSGAVFDGKYTYFIPMYDGTAYSGKILRLDTQGGIASSSSWRAYDASSVPPGNMVGFQGGVFDGQFIYLVPYRISQTIYSGRVLRYDTKLPFESHSSWTGYDVSGIFPAIGNMIGYVGGVFDGKYVTFVPHYDGTVYHGRVLRFNTLQNFTSKESWEGYDASNISPGHTHGYAGAVFDGTYLYFVPHYCDGAYHGRVLRFDSRKPFDSSDSWAGYDASTTSPGNMKGYWGGAYDGRFVYFSPYENPIEYSGRVLRYDTAQLFTSRSAWSGYDASGTGVGNMRGYRGVLFDGRYLLFIPFFSGAYHGRVLRYDAQGSFYDSNSWSGMDASFTGPGNMVGFVGGVFDGRFCYLAPTYDGAHHGRVLRYDTRSPQPRPSLTQIATSSELFIASDGSVGIGTTNTGPEKLTVEGGVKTSKVAMNGNTLILDPVQGSVYAENNTNNGTVYLKGSIIADLAGDDSFATSAVVESEVPSVLRETNIRLLPLANPSFIEKPTFDPTTKRIFLPVQQENAVYDGKVFAFDTRYGSTDFIGGVNGWEMYDAPVVDGYNVRGHEASVVCNGYLYMAHYNDPINPPPILRYKLDQPFTSLSSWSAFAPTCGFCTATYHLTSTCNGKYVYFLGYYQSGAHRYDTTLPFNETGSWELFNFATITGNIYFSSAGTDGRYLYFSGETSHAKVLRCDTQGTFSSSSSWTMIDVSTKVTGVSSFFRGTSAFYSPYIYFGTSGSKIVRYNTQSDFATAGSWQTFEIGTVDGVSGLSDFESSIVVGDSVFFIQRAGNYLLRYYPSSDSWKVCSISLGVNSLGLAWDGKYLYISTYESNKFLRMEIDPPTPPKRITQSKTVYIKNSNVGIGTSVPTEKLHVLGNIKAVGTISATSTCCSSDIRLKSNITSITNSLSTIKRMHSIRYNWKKNGEPSIGFVAQELEPIVPEVVVTGSDGYKAIDYGKLSAVLVGGIQEMEENTKSKVEQLESEIAELKRKNMEINGRLEKLEKLIL